MIVCEDCARHGRPAPPPAQKRITLPARKIDKDEKVFQSMKKVLVEDWSERIREARIRKGLSRQELGAKVGEPTVAIAKMENRDLRPSDETARKLEKVLGITLFEDVKEIHLPRSTSSGGITIGDLLKMEKQKDDRD